MIWYGRVVRVVGSTIGAACGLPTLIMSPGLKSTGSAVKMVRSPPRSGVASLVRVAKRRTHTLSLSLCIDLADLAGRCPGPDAVLARARAGEALTARHALP